MRLAKLPLLAAMALGCANQSNATERQMREQEQRMKRLSANCDRLEERVLALEAALRASDGRARPAADSAAARPDLPTVKVAPERPGAEAPPESDHSPDNAAEDGRRVLIVGEGARVEARAANENSTTANARQPPAANSRASKGNQGTFPAAKTSGAPK